ncbi:MAG: prepilin-type N-terminal cleavage/methylation domain-containing protein, partial [Planctomycetales bacterium]|nr:prepilin-type N-terminal cleavage/methylation domain-containing protein [Planctomycetales bacterium]
MTGVRSDGRCLQPSAALRRGFSLLELLVVVGLLASLTALSWPSMRRVMVRSERRTAAYDVLRFLADARHRAVRTCSPHLVRWDLAQAQLTLWKIEYDEVGVEAFALGGGVASEVGAQASRLATRRTVDVNDERQVSAAAAAADASQDLQDDQSPGPPLRFVDRLALPKSRRLTAAVQRDPNSYEQ